jgi:hypothetical protein
MFHTLERYYPTSPAAHLAACDVVDGVDRTVLLPSESIAWSVEELLRREPNTSNFKMIHKRGHTISGTKSSLPQCPVYALVRKPDQSDIVLITYVLFFNVTGRCKRSVSFGVQASDEDVPRCTAGIQSVTLQLSLLQPPASMLATHNSLNRANEYEIDRIYFHGANFWSADFRTRMSRHDHRGSPIRPLIYVSAFTHRLYPMDGVVFRSYFTDNDYTSAEGFEWEPTPCAIVLVEERQEKEQLVYSTAWMNYLGSWSEIANQIQCKVADITWWKNHQDESQGSFRGFVS